MVANRRLAAIMFTDMVGYTAATQSDEKGTLKLLHEQEALVRPLLHSYQGRKIKSTGDGFLVEFDSALRGVQCAIEILRRFERRNAERGVTPIRLRIGLHLGDVEELAGDIFGDAVNIASRIEPLASPGGLCISGQVFDQVRNKISNQFEKLAPTALKGVRLPVEVYRVSLSDDTPPARPELSPRTRLAVLPLANISPDPKDEYFADGLTEELISSLSKVQNLRVIARTSVGQYKATAKSIAQIAAELDVGSVLEGSVRKSGNRLRITLQLINAATQDHIWAHSYDRELDDVFAIQTEIAEKTAEALQLELLGPERESIRKRPTSSLAAYNLYLRGLHAFHRTTNEGFGEAIRFFGEAIQKDPDFSLAYSHLANTYLILSGDTIEPREACPRARELTARAIALDPTSADGHTARGNLALQCDQDWAVAETELRRAIALNPSSASAHFWYAILLKVGKRYGEAIEELTTTIELDPLWGLPRLWRTEVYEESGDLASAIASGEEERERVPQDPVAHLDLAAAYLRVGRVDEAREEAELASGAIPEISLSSRAVLWVALGKSEEARALISDWEAASGTRYIKPTSMAALYSVLGEKEKALDWLERGHREGNRALWLDYQTPAFDPIRQDARFQSILAEMHLPTDERPARPSVEADR